MCEASFYRIVLNLLDSLKTLNISNINNLAKYINSIILKTIKNEEKIEDKFNKYKPLRRFYRRNSCLKITLLELNILKLILESINFNEDIMNKYVLLKNYYPLIMCSIEIITSKIEPEIYQVLLNKK